MDARLRRSASACSSIAMTMPAGGAMSRISYRRHCRPHGSLATLIVCTMLELSASRSSNVCARAQGSNAIGACAHVAGAGAHAARASAHAVGAGVHAAWRERACKRQARRC
eukprot:363429-Chlamydomonas_euryale.AAC.33